MTDDASDTDSAEGALPLVSLHNLDLSPDAGANHLLALMRQMDMQGDLTSGLPILQGLFFSLDPDSATTGTYTSAPGLLLDMDFIVEHPGRWMALHVALGAADLTGRQVLGVVCKSTSPQATTFRVCLRSGQEAGGFVDHFLRKTVVAYASPSLHLDALQPEADPTLPLTAPWRELVLFFRPETSRITLHDLRIFIV